MEISIGYLAVVGFILDTLGKLLIAYAALMVHHRVRHDHKIDDEVFRAMKKEDVYGKMGIILIIVGASMELAAMLGIGRLLS